MTVKLTALLATAALAAPFAVQATTYEFNAALSGANEVPPNASFATGVATLFYDDMNTASFADDTYSFSMSVFNLSGPATAQHIHAPAPAGSNAPVLVPLAAPDFVVFSAGSTLLVGGAGVAAPNASFLGQLQGGLAYVNVHTAQFPGGETRGQLMQVAAVVPEPQTYAMLALGLGLVGWRLRARRR